MKHLTYSVIIATYNGETLLKNCLSSVLASSYPKYEVIIVDDGSADKSIQIIQTFQKKHTKVILVRNKKNLGLVKSRNEAINKTKGDILIFLDNDTSVDKNWIQGLNEVFTKDKSIGAAQCKIFDFRKRNIIQEIGMKLIPYTGFGTTIGRGEKDHGQYDEPTEIVSLGAALAVRREVVERIGGFDQKLFHYTDDLDFSWRIWLSGKRVVLAPNAKVYHYTHIHKPTYKLYYHLSKNSLRMIIKNYEIANLFKFLSSSIVFNMVGGLFVLLSRGKLIALTGVVVGFIWNVFNLRDTLRQRLKVIKYRRVKDHEIFPKIMINGNIFTFIKHYFRLARMTEALMR